MANAHEVMPVQPSARKIEERYLEWHATIGERASDAQMRYWSSGFFHAIASIYGDHIAHEMMRDLESRSKKEEAMDHA